MDDGNYKYLGPCELCGEESNQSGGGHTICTRCEEIWSQELRKLEPEEKASNAWDRAKQICRLKGKIDKLQRENKALKDEISRIESQLLSDTRSNSGNQMPIPNTSSSGLKDIAVELKSPWGQLVMSAGMIHASSYSGWLAEAKGGQIIRFNEEAPLLETDREMLRNFAATAKDVTDR